MALEHHALRQKSFVALLSVVSNTLLVLAKLIVGLAVGSVSIISEAIHSGLDLIAAIIAFVSVRTSGKPADDEHPYGHGKVENLSGMIEAVLIFVAAAWIIREAVHKFTEPKPLELVGWGAAVMLVSAAVNLLVSELLMRVGRKTDSIALRADAWHLRTDVYTSAGVMFALGVIWAAGIVFPKLNILWLDPVVAILVAILIIKAAWDLTAESVKDLLDVRLMKDEEDWIAAEVRRLCPAVRGLHSLRTRKSGHLRFIDFHFVVDGSMSVTDAHRISDQIDDAIAAQLAHSHVTSHVEPCDKSCHAKCVDGCFLPEFERRKMDSAVRAR